MAFIVAGSKDVTTARAILKRQTVNILLVDPYCIAEQGHPFIEEVKRLHPDTAIIATPPEGSGMTTRDAMLLGAADYLVKPFDREDLTAVLERTRQKLNAAVMSRRLRERLRSKRELGSLVGHSQPMEGIRRYVSRVANSTHPVLIVGEAGSGKELVARSIHLIGDRAPKPFVQVECNSFSPELHGSELFGHEKNAFRGADWGQRGLLAASQGGTVFLDEITDLSLELQLSLLGALRDKVAYPIGSSESYPISVRILAGTSREIEPLVERGQFRRDLYTFLNISKLGITPLRERSDDIPEMITHFLDRISRETRSAYAIRDELIKLMTSYSWPGNVRELENALEYACSRSPNGSLSIRDFPQQLQEFCPDAYQESAPPPPVESRPPSESEVYRAKDEIIPLAELERRAILSALHHSRGDRLEAARSLGIGKTTIYRKLKEYGLNAEGDLA